MPRLHFQLSNVDMLEEWDEIEQFEQAISHQKQSRRPRFFRSDAQEQRNYERRKYQRRANASSNPYP